MNGSELRALVVERARSDKEFRKSLFADPKGALSSLAGGALPADFTLDPADLGELSDEELAQITGGKFYAYLPSPRYP
ncbi:MAG TPA: bacteriocin [Chloroflexaceae bacterium]|nr:bacteriocin [Chloroflexaceae bacterium]